MTKNPSLASPISIRACGTSAATLASKPCFSLQDRRQTLPSDYFLLARDPFLSKPGPRHCLTRQRIGLLGVLGQAYQFGIWRTVDAVRVGEGFPLLLVVLARAVCVLLTRLRMLSMHLRVICRSVCTWKYVSLWIRFLPRSPNPVFQVLSRRMNLKFSMNKSAEARGPQKFDCAWLFVTCGSNARDAWPP